MSNVKRFTGVQILFHLGLVVTFMLLSVTGLAWMYYETAWGKALAGLFGGYVNTLEVHRITGLILLAGFVAQILYMLAIVDWGRLRKSLFGPDSMVFQGRDIVDFFKHLGWIVGIAKEPRFERWTWWEKFDYWAVWWGLVIVGITGLILYNPVLSSDFMPGWMLNVSLWIHRIEALLAMAHIFTIHFFVAHFRPRSFPFSATMFEGSKNIGELREEYPAWIERLEHEGGLAARLVPAASMPVRIFHFVTGYALIFLGIYLLIFAIANLSLLTLTP
jgi:cytochrome b subunit of formate dehydrogenase